MKRLIAIFCIISAITLSMSSCSGTDGEINATQADTAASTQEATQAVTKAPTQIPTQAPTQESTTEEPTQVYVPQEPATFSITINEPITAPPPTEIPTEIPTEEATSESTENISDLEDILGSWKLEYYERSDGQHTMITRSTVYTFKEDKTFTLENAGNIMTGRYSFSGEVLAYVSDVSGEFGNFEFDKKRQELRDTDEGSNTVAVFKRVS